jgi:hypothetical protein
MVAQVCNPSYLGGGDWEDQGLTPTCANSLGDLIATNKSWAQW